jgi:hypothetical protein
VQRRAQVLAVRVVVLGSGPIISTMPVSVGGFEQWQVMIVGPGGDQT